MLSGLAPISDVRRRRWHSGARAKEPGNYSPVALPLPTHLEIVNRWIAALSERKTDPFHDEIMDFAALLEGDLAKRFIDRFGQVKARMDALRLSGLRGCAGIRICAVFIGRCGLMNRAC